MPPNQPTSPGSETTENQAKDLRATGSTTPAHPVPHPFNPNTPLSRRSFVESPKPTPAQTSKSPSTKTSKPPTPISTVGTVAERPVGSPIPASIHPVFSDIRSTHWPTSLEFLRRFKASLITYIPDGEAHGALPVIHTYGVDGLTPSTTAFPDPSRQDQGYGMYFSVNGFKSNKSRREDNLYSLNAFYADIDWPDKKNPPTNEQMKAFKQAVYEDLYFCIANGREDFVNNPRSAGNPPPPTAIVETKNGFHVYWLFDSPRFAEVLRGSDEGSDGGVPVEREPFEKTLEKYRLVQTNIISRFQADPQCKDSTRVLRIPNSFHLKNPAEPFQIKLTYFEPNNVYSFDQGYEFWVQNPNAIHPQYAFHHAEEFARKVKEARVSRSREPREARTGSSPSSPFRPTSLNDTGTNDDVIQKLDLLYPKTERPSYKRLIAGVGIAEGTRNKSLLIAASALRESGWTELDTCNHFKVSGYSGLPTYEIINTVKSAFRGERAYDFGWNDPVLADCVTLEEASKVKGIVKEIMEAKRKDIIQSKKYANEKIGDKDARTSAGSSQQDQGSEHFLEDGASPRTPDTGSELLDGRDESGGTGDDLTGNVESDGTRNPGGLNGKDALETEESGELTISGINTLESAYKILDKPTQKRLYNIYDRLFLKYHPDIVSVDDVGFYRYDTKRRFYEPISEDGIRRLVSEDLSSIGCLDHRQTSHISAKVESLQAFREIRMSREESEKVLFSDGHSGTYVNTLSGFVDLDSGTLMSDMRLFVTSVLPVEYNANVATTPELLERIAPRWMSFLQEITRSNIPGEAENKTALLQEMAGYCFTPYTHFQTAFFLLGSGSNGKSTFLDAIISIIGDQDSATLNMEDLSSQFRLAGLYRKRLNVIEEISNSYFESDNLKKIISGQEITADRKFMQPIRFRPTAKLVFALNAFPRVNDQSHALYRRFKTIPFNATFDHDTKDIDLPRKLWAERDGIFRWAMQGWQRLKLTGKFTHTIESEQSGEDFKEHNSPLVEFILRDCILYEDAVGRLTKDMPPIMVEDFITPIDVLYTAYKIFAKENGYGVKGRQSFIKEMSSLTHHRLKKIRVSPSLSTVFMGVRLNKMFLPADEPKFTSFYHH